MTRSDPQALGPKRRAEILAEILEERHQHRLKVDRAYRASWSPEDRERRRLRARELYELSRR